MTAPMSATAAARADWRAIAICLFITIAAFQFGFDSSYYSGGFRAIPLSPKSDQLEFANTQRLDMF